MIDYIPNQLDTADGDINVTSANSRFVSCNASY